MEGTIIERPQTAEEKQDFILLGTKTIYDVFSQKVSEIMLEFNKKFKPFDVACARLDFRDKVESAERESQRTYGFVKEDLRVDIGDLTKYGKEDRFELIDDHEDVQMKMTINGERQETVGHTLSYKCKNRGHGIAVFIPIQFYEEVVGKKK